MQEEYTADASKLVGIFVLTLPFSPPPNRDIIEAIRPCLEEEKRGRLKRKFQLTLKWK
jgi:hypothetical protein